MEIEQSINIKDLNEERNSRMLAAHGLLTQSKLMKMNVFIHGLRGIGIETAKNLILAGPNQVCLHDDTVVSISDLGCNFYLQESQVGATTRGQASLPKLRDLNNFVKVTLHTGDDSTITPDFLKQFQVVVFTDCYNIAMLIEINQFCRSNHIGFIYAGILGLYGFTFVDFGDKFYSFDVNGEEPRNSLIFTISREKQAEVSVLNRHSFENGDHVVFREVEGMTEINDKVVPIQIVNPMTFKIDLDTTSFGAYTKQGIVEQVKVPTEFNFKSLQDSLQQPIAIGKSELDICDFNKYENPQQLHLALLAIFQFWQNFKGLPQLHSQYHADELIKIVKEINSKNNNDLSNTQRIKVDTINEELVRNLSLYARAQISPIASFWGGIVAQEVIKFTGKYTPLRQWLHQDFFEALSSSNTLSKQPINSRYDDFISIFGLETQKILSNQNIFLVGAGALGCEYLKLFAMLGISAQKNGSNSSIKITDDDCIEMSNLSRQFLFRNQDIRLPKSQCAAKAIRQWMNPDINVKDFQLRADPANEVVFNDSFWEGLDFVVNAVDNIQARKYIDNCCVLYGKPLFESGTLGTKCNSQIIIPNQSISYSESQDPPEDTIPLCTLKNFPYQIEHTIQWARDYFDGQFVKSSQDLVNFVQNQKQFIEEMRMNQMQKKNQSTDNSVSYTLKDRLTLIKKLVQALFANSYDSCITLAVHIFQEVLNNQIAQLIFAYPQNHLNKFGQLFWVGTHRFPHPISFSSQDETHIEFVQAAANIFANMFGLEYCYDREYIKKIASTVEIKPFKPLSNVIIKTEKDDQQLQAPVDQNYIEQEEKEIDFLIKDLSRVLVNRIKTKPNLVQFEKDNSDNFHIDFLSSLANLRASNYNINQVSKFKVKIIAGKIIPALATTTAMIVGAVGMEIIKYIQKLNISNIRDSFNNLALPFFLFTDPMPPKKYKDNANDVIMGGPVKCIPSDFTIWDSIQIKGPKTLEQLIDHFKMSYKVNIKNISIGNFILFDQFSKDKNTRIKQDIQQLYEQIINAKIHHDKKFLVISVCGQMDGQDPVDIITPLIKYYL